MAIKTISAISLPTPALPEKQGGGRSCKTRELMAIKENPS
jgi:hypothetical protein